MLKKSISALIAFSLCFCLSVIPTKAASYVQNVQVNSSFHLYPSSSPPSLTKPYPFKGTYRVAVNSDTGYLESVTPVSYEANVDYYNITFKTVSIKRVNNYSFKITVYVTSKILNTGLSGSIMTNQEYVDVIVNSPGPK